MIPLTVDVPMKRLPWANWGLILATIIISLAVPATHEEIVVTPSPRTQPSRPPMIETRQALSRLVLQRDGFAVYQPITALFQHADLLHLLGNMLFLFVFGNAINAKLGHLSFLASYLAIGAVANLIWLAAGPGDACLGASGAIMGMCGMFLVFYPFNHVTVWWDELVIPWSFRRWINEIPGWAVVLLYLAFDVWGAIFDRHSGIGYVSHILGSLLGIGLAVLLLVCGWMGADRGEQTLLQWLAGAGPVDEGRAAERRRRKRADSSSAIE